MAHPQHRIHLNARSGRLVWDRNGNEVNADEDDQVKLIVKRLMKVKNFSDQNFDGDFLIIDQHRLLQIETIDLSTVKGR
jgi:hypothetical protein